MIITPLDAREPYIAEADASFKTVNDSMSLGLINESGLATPDIPLLLNGTLSITIKGSLLALSEAPPLILIVLPEPGAPPFEVICTPATLPAISCSGLVNCPCTKSLEETLVTLPVKSFLRTEP